MVFNKFRNNKDEVYESYQKQIKENNKKIKKLEKLTNTHQEMLNNIFIFYELKPTPFLSKMRNLGYEMLKFMDNICRKYDLEWWIDYGTLLGAVRHRNYVPWDDDLDCGMMRKDLNVFMDIIDDEIAENDLKYMLPTYKFDKHNELKTRRWFQIKYRHPDFKGSFSALDIFPYDYIRDYKGEDIEDKFNKLMWNYYSFSKDDDVQPYLDKVFKDLNLTLEKDTHLISSVESPRGEAGYATVYPFKVIKYEDIFPVTRVDFGNYNFPAPNNTKKYVKDIYGKNYMKIPNKLREHGLLEKHVKQDNILDALQEGIDMLQKANSNY